MVPALAVGLTFLVSAIWVGVYAYCAHKAHQDYVAQGAEHVIAAAGPDIAAGNWDGVEARLSELTPARAALVLSDGTEKLGSVAETLGGNANFYPVVVDGQTVATLAYRSASPLDLHTPLVTILMWTVICCLAMFLVAHMLSRKIAQAIKEQTRAVSQVSIDGMNIDWGPAPLFAEFRTLKAAIKRAARSLDQEIEQLRTRSEIDDRTGLYNQYYLKSAVDACLETAGFDKPSALILVSVDGLGVLSAQLGSSRYLSLLTHIGSELLDASQKMTEELGLPADSWVLSCLPSDQFGLLATGFSSRDDIAPIVRRIHARFRGLVSFDGVPVKLKASGSIVMLPEDGDTQPVVMQRAETTLQSLRSDKAGGFRFYSPKLERQNESRRKFEAELRAAVDEERFIPLFQPKIDMQTGLICGVEALARWQLDNGRLVAPGAFITLAEEIGLIDRIGQQIMHRACNAAARWARNGHRLNLAVNVSPRQFESDGLVDMILDGIAGSGLAPRQLELEITESLAIEQPERVRSVLSPLRKMGIGLAVDDFGTGHSNLAILTQFEFDVFKIDRQFVSGLPGDAQSAAIVDLMVGMATSLGMKIVGEGIETKAQADFMAQKGCSIGQGYLYSPPITEAELLEMLASQSAAKGRQSA